MGQLDAVVGAADMAKQPTSDWYHLETLPLLHRFAPMSTMREEDVR